MSRAAFLPVALVASGVPPGILWGIHRPWSGAHGDDAPGDGGRDDRCDAQREREPERPGDRRMVRVGNQPGPGHLRHVTGPGHGGRNGCPAGDGDPVRVESRDGLLPSCGCLQFDGNGEGSDLALHHGIAHPLRSRLHDSGEQRHGRPPGQSHHGHLQRGGGTCHPRGRDRREQRDREPPGGDLLQLHDEDGDLHAQRPVRPAHRSHRHGRLEGEIRLHREIVRTVRVRLQERRLEQPRLAAHCHIHRGHVHRTGCGHPEWHRESQRPSHPGLVRIRHGSRSSDIFEFARSGRGKRIGCPIPDHTLELSWHRERPTSSGSVQRTAGGTRQARS